MTGLRAFEGQMPFQKYQGPPIVVRCLLFCLFIAEKILYSIEPGQTMSHYSSMSMMDIDDTTWYQGSRPIKVWGNMSHVQK